MNKKERVVLVAGDRDWDNLGFIKEKLTKSTATVLVHGGARGADRQAALAAEQLGIAEVEYEADWEKLGRAAGPTRNIEMFDKEQPDIVLAFHNDIAGSKGTKHMVEYANKRGCTVVLFSDRRVK